MGMDEVVFNPTGAERLITLAEFLETQVKDEEFDFNRFMVRKVEHSCGTVGCAIGQMPRIWPEEVEAVETTNGLTGKWYKIHIKGCDDDVSDYAAAEFFFGLTGYEARAIFSPDTGYYPNPQFPDEDLVHDQAGLKVLGEYAKPKEVAANIRDFVGWKLKQEAA